MGIVEHTIKEGDKHWEVYPNFNIYLLQYEFVFSWRTPRRWGFMGVVHEVEPPYEHMAFMWIVNSDKVEEYVNANCPNVSPDLYTRTALYDIAIPEIKEAGGFQEMAMSYNVGDNVVVRSRS